MSVCHGPMAAKTAGRIGLKICTGTHEDPGSDIGGSDPGSVDFHEKRY